MGGRHTLFLTVLVAFVVVATACASDQPKAPDNVPQTVAEFFEALDYGIHKDGKVFHARVEIHSRENGNETLWATTEGWVSEDGKGARATWLKGPGNTADLAERNVHIHTPAGVYSANLDGDDDPSFRLPTDSEPCFPQAQSEVLALVACGFLEFGRLEDVELSVERSLFQGRATISLVARYPVSSPLGSEEFPHGGPAPHPVLTTAKQGEYRFHLDAATYLPLAAVGSVDSDPDRQYFGFEARFTTDFVPNSAVPKDWFESGSIGYVPPEEAERLLLEDPKLEAAVYWLGRTFDPGNGLPKLGDLDVNSYGPGRPQTDAPNIQLGLSYRSSQGLVRLDLYPPGDWEAFKARLGGNFPWTWCGESREFSAGGARITILAGYESFPYKPDLGGVTIIPVNPGQVPPIAIPITPTVPPLKTESCPATPHDRFMAEVRFADATVVINGTLGFGGQDGRPWGVFDTAEALETVARGLRPRQPGE